MTPFSLSQIRGSRATGPVRTGPAPQGATTGSKTERPPQSRGTSLPGSEARNDSRRLSPPIVSRNERTIVSQSATRTRPLDSAGRWGLAFLPWLAGVEVAAGWKRCVTSCFLARSRSASERRLPRPTACEVPFSDSSAQRAPLALRVASESADSPPWRWLCLPRVGSPGGTVRRCWPCGPCGCRGYERFVKRSPKVNQTVSCQSFFGIPRISGFSTAPLSNHGSGRRVIGSGGPIVFPPLSRLSAYRADPKAFVGERQRVVRVGGFFGEECGPKRRGDEGCCSVIVERGFGGEER